VAAGAFLWQAMAGSPRRYLLSWWPWRCLAYLVTSVLIGLALVCVLPLGILFPPALILAALPVGALERRRLRLIDAVPADSPHATPSPGLGAWLWLRLAEGATWREFGYMLTLTTVLLAVDFVSLLVLLGCVITLAGPLFVAGEGVFRVGPLVADTIGEALALSLLLGPVVTVLGLYGMSAVAGAQGAYTRWLLAPRRAESDRKVEELAGSRTRLVNAFEVERRRIERDLHDGAQQHLVLLSMTLGLARLELDGTDGSARTLVTDAHDQARQALAAIRELIHGIHPQVLTDLGVAAAVGELAERCRVPVEVDIRLDGRLPPETETTAYFVVSESLTNAVKHAAAGKITVTGRLVDGWLVVMVSDDGSGGADPGRGSGLRGLVDRAAVMDGTLVITSPAGGPTTIRMELPCRCA
jgi:signal transduction histidine kinase